LKEEDLSSLIDDEGLCIFHSKDIKWKEESNFQYHFDKLLEILLEKGEKTLDFTHFILVGNKKRFIVKDIINQKVSFDFSNAEFKTSVDFLNLDINDFMCNDAVFQGSIRIFKSSFLSMRFEDMIANGVFNMQETTIRHNAFFTNSRFLQLGIFQDINFEGGAYFTKCIFDYKFINEYEEPVVRFDKIVFGNSTNFNMAKFYCGIDLWNSTANGSIEFTDTQFSRNDFSSFRNIIVNKSMIFKGTNPSPKKKLFPFKFGIDITEDQINGQIHFENVNFYNISPQNKEMLIKMSYGDKVVIGSGCLKYKVQTPLIKIPVDSLHHNLVKEFTTSFSNYFSFFNGINLGVEIVHQQSDYIEIFYFTDDDITQEELLRRIDNTGQNFLQDDSIVENKNIVNPKQSVTIIENFTSKLLSFFNIRLRQQVGLWTDADSESLIKSIPSNNKISINAFNVTINHHIKQMASHNIQVTGEKAQVIVADDIKELSYQKIVNSSITEEDFSFIKDNLSLLSTEQQEILKQELVLIENKQSTQENLLTKFKGFLSEHQKPMAQSLSASVIFEVLKEIFKLM